MGSQKNLTSSWAGPNGSDSAHCCSKAAPSKRSPTRWGSPRARYPGKSEGMADAATTARKKLSKGPLSKKISQKAVKVGKRHWSAIKKGLRLGWSPENISCRMKAERFGHPISPTTIYRLLEKDRIAGGQLYKLLPRFGKTRRKGGKRKAGILRTPLPPPGQLAESGI